MRIRTSAATSLACLAAVAASAQAPVGPEFQINTATYYYQTIRGRQVAVAPNGDFVVIWPSEAHQNGQEWDVLGQLFDAAGARRGGEFQVVPAITMTFSSFPPEPSVAMDGAGNFVVTWWR